MATERIYPDADITTNWDGWSSPPHWSIVDDPYGSETEADGGIAGTGSNFEELRFANVAVMGAGDICSQLEVFIWCKDNTITDQVDIKYSTDGGSSCSAAQRITVNQTSYAYEIATFSGLSLTQTQVNALAIQFACVGAVDYVISSAISVLVTYAPAGPTPGGGPVDDRFRGRRSQLMSYTSTQLRRCTEAWSPRTGILNPSLDAWEDNDSRMN